MKLARITQNQHKTNPAHGRLVLLLITFLLLALASCSSDSSDPIDDPIANPKPNPNPNPTPETETQRDIDAVDGAIQDFMQKYGVPGAAFAVSANEKMVYTKGYGLSNTASNTATKNDDRFRLASITKVFTATAIWKLVDENKLNLTDKVFGPEGLLGDDFGDAAFTEDELKITVDHLLLNESGGWSVNTGGDPIDYEPGLGTTDFITYVLKHWELQHAPGESFNYSNTGYWLLARIVETVSGEKFEDYLSNLIAPAGITSFKITDFTQEDREANEVEYYGTADDQQYVYTIAARRDGDGGGVISAPDLLRFLCAIDGASGRADIISSHSASDRAKVSDHFDSFGRGMGYWDAQDLMFFTGSLPGTRTWFMIGENGRSAVILLNYRRFDLPEFDADLQALLLNMVKDNSIPWQTSLDQF
jgi:CubicO group peptidase (beta-lactamase class C family)